MIEKERVCVCGPKSDGLDRSVRGARRKRGPPPWGRGARGTVDG